MKHSQNLKLKKLRLRKAKYLIQSHIVTQSIQDSNLSSLTPEPVLNTLPPEYPAVALIADDRVNSILYVRDIYI